MKRDVSEFLSSCSVNGVREPRMIGIKFRAVRQDLIGKSIEVSNASGKPRNRLFYTRR